MSDIPALVLDIRRLILDLELRPQHLFLTRVRPAGEDDYAGHERERHVRLVLSEMRAHGLTVHDVCTGWMLPLTPDSSFAVFDGKTSRIVGADRDEIKHAAEGEKTMDMRDYMGSSFIKVDDLSDGPHQDRIVGISIGKFDRPVAEFENGSKLSINATNTKALIRAYGPDSNGWTGKIVEQYVGQTKYENRTQDSVLLRPISPPTATAKRGDLDDEIAF